MPVVLGDSSASVDGDCGQTAFACQFNGSASVLNCK
jgi:hypothetical protein